jgi:beta-lactamase superfamily II metal-dependent hydrolase
VLFRSDIPPTTKDSTPETVQPSLTLVAHDTNYEIGLGLVYLLPNGKFLIVDGGEIKAAELYSLLQKLAPNKNNIVITAWYISHSHVDHQKTIIEFVEKKFKNVKIESILYNYPTRETYKAITSGSEGGSDAQYLINTLKNNTDASTKIIKPHSGQIYNYGSSTVEVLYTMEDRLPQPLDYLNTSSLVLKIKVGKHSMMALTDTTHVSGEILRKMYGSYLQCEMVQIAHHGFHAGYANLYDTIKGKVLIWPSNAVGVKKQLNDSTVKAALKHASDVYIANVSSHTTIKLPYTIKNNKQQVLNNLGG